MTNHEYEEHPLKPNSLPDLEKKTDGLVYPNGPVHSSYDPSKMVSNFKRPILDKSRQNGLTTVDGYVPSASTSMQTRPAVLRTEMVTDKSLENTTVDMSTRRPA